jgi:hypothetical protein
VRFVSPLLLTTLGVLCAIASKMFSERYTQ